MEIGGLLFFGPFGMAAPINGRMKRFRVLSTRFRHRKGTKQKMELHKACAEAVCVIVHYRMENGSPLFEM